jgi:lysophospholipase L1-like esterase
LASPLVHRLRRAAVTAVGTVGAVVLTSCSSGGTSDAGAAAATSLSSSAATSSSRSAGSGTYLALGDSVPFGYRGGLAPQVYQDPTGFVGYPQLVGKDLGLDVVNAACPGETSETFTDVTAQSNGCENTLTMPAGYRTTYPLHVDYAAPDQSQLDFALSTLQHTDDVQLLTVQLGANDAFLCQQTTADQCTSEIGTVATTVQTNLSAILATLRSQGGYDGPIVVVTYYALDYSDATASGTQVLDSGIAAAAKANGAIVASGYDAFGPTATGSGGSSVDGGLVLPGDVHPTEQGQRLLARAVEAVVPR